VEILDGVEGLVHISELAQHHVENPREIIQPGDPVRVKILEIDSERRRLSLSIKRVEGQVLPVRPIVPPTDGDTADLDNVPELGLSEDVFASSDEPAAPVDSAAAPFDSDAAPDESAAAPADGDAAEAEAGSEPEASAEPEPEGQAPAASQASAESEAPPAQSEAPPAQSEAPPAPSEAPPEA
jgi:small subunit ribosomal protein S1